MNQERIIVVLKNHKKGTEIDIDIPLDITANELIVALNSAYSLNLGIDDLSSCYLKTENPISLLHGNKLLYEFGLRNGTIINVL